MAANQQTLPPPIEFQGVLSRSKVERGEFVTVFLFVANKSDLPISWTALSLSSGGFDEQARDFSLPQSIPPFTTTQGKISFKCADSARFGTQNMVLTAQYSWTAQKQSVSSVQALTLPLEVTRRFEDESKGFPGGTAAFLYLLLPVIPAFLSYQLFETLRKREPLGMPEFKAAHVVPAFLAAIVISFVMLVFTKRDVPIDYSSPKVFLVVLAISLVAGTLIPTGKYFYGLIQSYFWSFSTNDDAPTYFKKAVLGPSSRQPLQWVTGEVANEKWSGFLLKQPNGDIVLGAQVQASPKSAAAQAFENDKLANPKLLNELIEAGQVKLAMSEAILRGEALNAVQQKPFALVLKDFKPDGPGDFNKPLVVMTA